MMIIIIITKQFKTAKKIKIKQTKTNQKNKIK